MKQRGFATILLLIVVLVGGVIGGVYYLGKTGVIPKFPGSATTSQNPASSVEQPPAPPEVPSEDETASWETYTRDNTFEIKHPSHIKVWWDESNDSYILFYREGAADPRGRGQGQDNPDKLCCGLSIYLRNPKGMSESESRPTENVTIAQYSGVRWTDNPQYMEDIWIDSLKKNIIARFSITTRGELPQYQKEDFETYKKMLGTFRFLGFF